MRPETGTVARAAEPPAIPEAGTLALQLSCGRCHAAVGCVAVPAPPPYSAWPWELRTILKPLFVYVRRRVPVVARFIDSLTSDRPYSVVADMGALYSQFLTCASCERQALPKVTDA